jgi:hypothetical protein
MSMVTSKSAAACTSALVASSDTMSAAASMTSPERSASASVVNRRASPTDAERPTKRAEIVMV